MMEMSSGVIELGDSAIRKVASKFETADNSGKGLISTLGNSSTPFGITTRVLGASSDLSQEVVIRHTSRLTSVVSTDVGDLMPLWLNDYANA